MLYLESEYKAKAKSVALEPVEKTKNFTKVDLTPDLAWPKI